VNVHDCEFDQFEDYLWLKNSYMLSVMVDNQLLFALVDVLMTPEILLSVRKFLSYLLNQVPLFHPLHPCWFHIFFITSFLFNSFDDCNASTVCHQLEENGFSYSACKEVGSIIQRIHRVFQIDLSVLTTN